MKLTFNEGLYVFGGKGEEAKPLAEAAGLTLSRPSSRRVGGLVYFTPEPCAVLHLWEYADLGAKSALAALRAEWELSGAKAAPPGFEVPVPEFCELMPFQKGGVYYAKDRANVLIGDAPGLGKTMQSIALANLRRAKRVLVICPANVRPQWQRQIKIWSTIERPIVYPIYKTSDGVHPKAHWVITSYEVARDGLWDVLRSYEWDMVIIDEAHYLKTPDAARTRALFGASRQSKCRYAGTGGIAERAGQIVALTGTPLPNRPRECFTLAKALDHAAIDWMNLETFKDRFNPGGRDWETGATWEYTGRLPELNARLRTNFMVRRLKEDVLKDLPAKRYELVYAEGSGAISMALHAERMLDIDPDTLLARNRGAIDGAISTVRRQMGEALAPFALDHCTTLLDGGVGKLVVFAYHHSVLAVLEKGLSSHGVIRVDGNTSAKQKHAAVETFKFDPRRRVFLGQMQAVGTGTDGLQDVASHAVFAEPDWVPGTNEQCVDRLHRMGQEGSVLAQFIVAESSLSERIIGRSIQKARVTNEVLDGVPVAGDNTWVE